MAKVPSLDRLLDEQRSALDELLGEISLGIRHQRHFADLEERAQAIGQGIRDAFRKGRR